MVDFDQRAAQPLARPRGRPGEFAVIVQDPPVGLPRPGARRVASCEETKTGKGTELLVTLAPPRRLRQVGWQLVPLRRRGGPDTVAHGAVGGRPGLPA